MKKKHIVTRTYDEMRDSLDTGDVLIFSGKGRISNIIKLVSYLRLPFKWLWMSSHVAGVFREGNRLYCFESTTLNGVSGVQLSRLSERIEDYNGAVAVRRLHCERTPEFRIAAGAFVQEMLGTPYEEDIFELWRSAYDGPFGGNNSDLNSVFCSELIAEWLERTQTVIHRLPANEYTPRDFECNIPVFGPADYGQMVVIS